MSTPLINQLFEEAGERCTELAARATAAAAAAGLVVEHAQAIGHKAVDEAERLHREYTEAREALTHAVDQAAHAATASVQGVDSVTPEVQKAATDVNEMLVAMEGALGQLGQERGRRFHELDESMRHAQEAFHGLATEVATFAEHVGARVNEAAGQINHFEDVLKQAHTTLEKAQERAYEEMDILGRTAATITDAAAHGIEGLLAVVGSGLLDTSNNAIRGHNEVVAELRHGYLDETKAGGSVASYFDAAFDKIREALSRFEQVPEPIHSALHTALTAVREESEKVVNALSQAGQQLEHSHGVVTS